MKRLLIAMALLAGAVSTHTVICRDHNMGTICRTCSKRSCDCDRRGRHFVGGVMAAVNSGVVGLAITRGRPDPALSEDEVEYNND